MAVTRQQTYKWLPNYLNCLPVEILMKVLEFLGFQDLIKVSLVSKKLYSLATDPVLWKAFELEPSDYKNHKGLLAILQLDRFSKLETLHLCQERESSDVKKSNALVEQIRLAKIFSRMEEIGLKHLTIQHFDLTSLSPQLLSRVLNKTENVYLNHCVDIRDDQIVVTIENMVDQTKVKTLQIESLDISQIKIKSLSKAINSLENFFSLGSKYSNKQLENIFETMATDTNLKNVAFFASLKTVAPGTLANAINKLESIIIGHPLAPKQLLSFFQQLAGKSSIKNLFFMFKDSQHNLLASIPANILSKSLNKLDTVVMPHLMLTNNQMVEMFEGIARSNSNIKSLDLGKNIIPDVSLDLLKNVNNKLELNSFKIRLQRKILEISENKLESMMKNLMEKKMHQEELRNRIEKLKDQAKSLRDKINKEAEVEDAA